MAQRPTNPPSIFFILNNASEFSGIKLSQEIILTDTPINRK